MGVLDKFLDIMKLSDDDDYEDDDFFEDDDYEDEYEKPAKKGGLLSKLKGKSYDDEYDDDYDDEEAEERPAAVSKHSARANENKITPMRRPATRKSGPSMEVCVIKPSSVEDAREITETLLNGRTVILNLEGMDLEIAQRIIDFTSGAAFAISGNLQKISNYIFLVTPTNVDISGDLQDLLNSSFDASSMRTRF